jgi:DNA-binding beta-propeller fold protein YncE
VGLAFAPDGTILAANTARGQVCRFRWDGGLVQVLGRQGSGVRFLFYPHGVAVAPDGTVLVTDHGNHVVHAYAPDGNLVAFAGGYGNSDGRFIEPHGIAVGKNGKVYVGDNGNKRIQVLDQGLKWLETIDLAEIGVRSIVGVLVLTGGRLAVSDRDAGKVWVVNDRGRLEGVLVAGPSFQPLWIAADSDENIWVGDAAKRVAVFGRDKLEKTIGDLGERLSFYPQGMAFGPKGELGVVNYPAGKIVIVKKAMESLSGRR